MEINYNERFEKFFDMHMKGNIVVASISIYKISTKGTYHISEIIADLVRSRFCLYCVPPDYRDDRKDFISIYDEAGHFYDDVLRIRIKQYVYESIMNYRQLNETSERELKENEQKKH